jgi:anti-sigma factor RsiW
MEADTLHDLTAAYALDALDGDDARAYEAHLARCERCRAELASLAEASTALAYAGNAPPPPPELRARILQQARSERPNVVPLRPRWALPAAAAIAAVAACAAVGLGLWAASLSGRLDRRNEALAEKGRVAAIVADPAARRLEIPGGHGTLVVTPAGEGALVLAGLRPAPAGRTYEAWVARGQQPEAAGTFDGGNVVLARLERLVPRGATVLVTVEKRGGVAAPTTKPFIRVDNPARS